MNQLNALGTVLHRANLRKLFILGFVAFIAILLYWHWNQVIVQVVELQRDFHTRLASHINAVAKDPDIYGWALITLSFAYGVFHAIGPGHGKAVIATYLGTHRESISKGMAISMATALLQSIVAIVLVSVLAKVLQLRFSDIDNYGEDLALVSYVLVMLLGLVLSISAIRRFIYLNCSRNSTNTTAQDSHDHNHAGHHEHDHETHDHHADCGCKHAYVPESGQSWLQTMAVIFSIGVRPCSGAVLVLIYAHLVGVFHYGIVATLCMGLGTGLSVSAIALGSQYARQWLESMMLGIDDRDQGSISPALISISVRLVGGALLILMGWGLYQTALRTSLGHPLF
ncbi:MAG: nickel/cobalt transporter [Pseudomonadota bacterium]